MKRAAGELLFCSLGFSPTRTPTLQVLQALRRCDVVFCGEASPGLLKLLRLFCEDCRPLPARRGVQSVLAAAKPGAVVGFAVFGQPMVFGPVARELSRAASERGLSVSVLSGLSAFDCLLAANREVFGYGFGWYQVLEDCRPEALALVGTLDARLPTAAYLKAGSSSAARKGVLQRLQSSYPASRGCALFEVSETGERRNLRRCAVAELEEAVGDDVAGSFILVGTERHAFG